MAQVILDPEVLGLLGRCGESYHAALQPLAREVCHGPVARCIVRVLGEDGVTLVPVAVCDGAPGGRAFFDARTRPPALRRDSALVGGALDRRERAVMDSREVLADRDLLDEDARSYVREFVESCGHARVVAMPLLSTGDVVGVVSFFAAGADDDVDMARLERFVERMASAVRVVELERLVDPLTGLANHSRFHDALAAAVLAAQAQSGALVLLLGDLDGLRGVNDRLGHAQGDEVLQRTAAVLRECFGGHLVGRLGGDEFGVVLRGVALDSAANAAGRAAQRVALLDAGLGISWGAATFPSDGPSPQVLLLRASLTLDEAKRVVAGSRPRPSVAADKARRLQLEAYARDVRAGYARERRKARDLLDSYLATVLALAGAVAAKDDATGGHIHRVRALGLLLAEVVCPQDLDDPQLAYGLLLHDIGKLVIPDAVLNKPGKLDEDEWALMRTHPQAGIDILAPVTFLGRALDIVGHHHERWDGGGYPDGLAGEQIPLWARVFAVADTVDAMTADRPYRKGLPFQTALNEVDTQSGRQFDPACARALASLPVERILPLLEGHHLDELEDAS